MMLHTLTVLFLSLTLVASAENVVVDLSQPLETASLNNPGATAIRQTAMANPSIRTSLVLEHGKIVAEYIRSDVDPTTPNHVWSATKSWMSLLFGIMWSEGSLDLNKTLGDIFTNNTIWENVNSTEFRKSVTIHEMLTMSSGLISPPLDPTETFTNGGNAGGSSLTDSLAYPAIGEKGVFSYLGVSNILSYVLQEQTNSSPREYLSAKVLLPLGILDNEIGWWQNKGGMEYSYHGMELTPHQMAKFGQLYLQDGLSAPNSSLVSKEWIAKSTSPQVDASALGTPIQYGYLFWVANGSDVNLSDTGEFYCALGLGGQDICVYPALNRVSVQQQDVKDFFSQGSLIMTSVAFNKTLSFHNSSEVVNGSSSSMPSSGSERLKNFSMLSFFWTLALFVSLFT